MTRICSNTVRLWSEYSPNMFENIRICLKMLEYGLKPITTDNNRYETDKIPITDNRKTILPLWYIVLSVGTDNDMFLPGALFLTTFLVVKILPHSGFGILDLGLRVRI